MKPLKLDIIDTYSEKFMYQLRYPMGGLTPAFPLTGLEILNFIYSKYSFLKRRKFSVGVGEITLTKDDLPSLVLIFNDDFSIKEYKFT